MYVSSTAHAVRSALSRTMRPMCLVTLVVVASVLLGACRTADQPTEAPPEATAEPVSMDTTEPVATDVPEATAAPEAPPCPENEFEIIPIEGALTEDPDTHGDLNVLLREPETMEADLDYVQYEGGTDADAPQLGKVLGRQPEFASAYRLHEWDWGTNAVAEQWASDHPSLMGVATEPGEEVFIPNRGPDIYQGRFRAILAYATEDAVQLIYSRQDTVAHGYAVYMDGLIVDCNLLALYRQGRESGEGLPGLDLETPIGVTTGEELRIAVRDTGRFMDPRSTKDWWAR